MAQKQEAVREPIKGTIDDVKNAKARAQLAELLAERARVTRERKALEEEERVLNETIIPILQRMGFKSLLCPDDNGELKTFMLLNGSNTSVDRKALLGKGVDPGIIEACLRRTEFTTLSVREFKGGD